MIDRIKRDLKKLILWSFNKLHVIDICCFLLKPLKSFLHSTVDMDSNTARKNLQGISAKPIGKGIKSDGLFDFNTIDEKLPYDLQIVVPAYNVKKYLEVCMESILSQKTTYSFIVYLVDDGSTDGTSELIEKFATSPLVKVIHQQNRGFSGARNRGMQKIEARYLMFVDSDDFLYENAIQHLMEAAIQKDAEIVQGNFHFFYGNDSKELAKKTTSKGKKIAPLDPLNMQCYPWGKVYKNSLFKRFEFPEQYYYEDTIIGFLIVPSVSKVYQISNYVYGYRTDNSLSISRTNLLNPKRVDTYWITEELMAEHEQLNLPNDDVYAQRLMKQTIINYDRTRKFPLIIRQSIFVLTCDLLQKYIKTKNYGKHQMLGESLENRNFKLYEWYCKLRRF